MKKQFFIPILVSVIIILLIVVWGILVCCSRLENGHFFYITFEGLCTIAITVLIGGLLTVLVLVYSNFKEKNHRLESIIKETLSVINKMFSVDLDGLKVGTKEFWMKSLCCKKTTNILINEILKMKNPDSLSESLDNIKKKTDDYFSFVEGSCYPKALLREELLVTESNKRYEIIAQIHKTLLCLRK